jgi:hypothetical protein
MNHIMELEETYEDGSERWKCPECGREFIVSWPPNYHKEVLFDGDLSASHGGGRGGLSVGLKVNASGLDDIWLEAFNELTF